MQFRSAIFALFFLFLIAGCGNDNNARQTAGNTRQSQPVTVQHPTATPIFRSVSPQEAQALIKARQDLLLIDVRSPQELREGRIAGSRLVPFWEIAKGRYVPPANRPLLLICAVGGRSYAVAKYFAQNDYPEVYNLQGGISAWKRAGLPVQY